MNVEEGGRQKDMQRKFSYQLIILMASLTQQRRRRQQDRLFLFDEEIRATKNFSTSLKIHIK